MPFHFLAWVLNQSRPTLCDPMNCIPSGSSVYGIFQARILEWVAMPLSRGSSPFRPPTWQADSLPSEPPGKPKAGVETEGKHVHC